jgi:adenylate cyclase
MAPDVAKKILVEKNFFALEGETRECALMVVELRGTEALESTSTPQMGVQTLNQYFTLIQDSVARQGGLVDYFLSHQAHAAWGVPFPTENPAAKAAQSALEIMENLITLNTEKISKNEPTLDFSIGLHYGPVTAGNIGSDRLYGYSVTGRRVETTKALALYADPRQILATSEFIRQGGDALSATLLPSRSLEKLGETALYEISAKP